MIEILPWHLADWSRIAASVAGLHHGLMLTGSAGIGKREFAVKLAQRLLCGLPRDGVPCGDCQDCKLFGAASHPDFHVLTTEFESIYGRIDLVKRYSDRYQDSVARDKKPNPGKVIPVDHVRLLIDRFYQSSHISAARVALILPADRMNASAANALLKLLEEPPENALFILVTEFPGMLPSTVRSRCILNTLSVPALPDARRWISLQAGNNEAEKLPQDFTGGPIDALQDLESGLIQQQQENLEDLFKIIAGQSDPVVLAAKLAKQDVLPLLVWLHQLSSDWIKWQAVGNKSFRMGKFELKSDKLSPIKLHTLYDKIGRYKRMARDQLNAQLALEELLIFMQQIFVPIPLVRSR